MKLKSKNRHRRKLDLIHSNQFQFDNKIAVDKIGGWSNLKKKF